MRDGGSSSKINDSILRASLISHSTRTRCTCVGTSPCQLHGMWIQRRLPFSFCVYYNTSRLKFPRKHREINSHGAHKMSGILCDPVNLRIKVLQPLPAFVEKPQLAYHRQSQLSLCSTCPLSDPLSDAISYTKYA